MTLTRNAFGTVLTALLLTMGLTDGAAAERKVRSPEPVASTNAYPAPE